ncbi:MAG: STAS domain-containing protein [Melioribacteraceae bacterium]|nr:STAS domain-containing protein [Melioribacteraceae bacterium]
MRVTVKEVFNAVVVGIKGKLVGGPKAKEFHNILLNSRNRNKLNIIVDLKNVTHIDSAGIGILVRGYTSMVNSDGNLKLAGISDKVKGVLAITKLNTVFEQYPNVEEAAKSYNSKIKK